MGRFLFLHKGVRCGNGTHRVAVGCCCCMTGRETFPERCIHTSFISFGLFCFFSPEGGTLKQEKKERGGGDPPSTPWHGGNVYPFDLRNDEDCKA